MTQPNSDLGPHSSTTEVELWIYSSGIEVGREDLRELLVTRVTYV
jgi:hypothetical protein